MSQPAEVAAHRLLIGFVSRTARACCVPPCHGPRRVGSFGELRRGLG